jgi:hypothetical protein
MARTFHVACVAPRVAPRWGSGWWSKGPAPDGSSLVPLLGAPSPIIRVQAVQPQQSGATPPHSLGFPSRACCCCGSLGIHHPRCRSPRKTCRSVRVLRRRSGRSIDRGSRPEPVVHNDVGVCTYVRCGHVPGVVGRPTLLGVGPACPDRMVADGVGHRRNLGVPRFRFEPPGVRTRLGFDIDCESGAVLLGIALVGATGGSVPAASAPSEPAVWLGSAQKGRPPVRWSSPSRL